MRTAALLAATIALVACKLPESSSSAAASTAADPLLAARCAQLADRALADNHAIEILKGLVTAAPKRLSGSPGYNDAVQWGLATMREIGLENIRAEPCMVPCWVRGEERAEVVGAGAMPLRVCALGGSIATPEHGIEAEVIEVRTFEQLQELGEKARGKIVFFNRPLPRILRRTGQAYGEAVPQRSNGAIEAGKVGAIGAIVRSMTTTIDEYPHTGAMHYDEAVTKVPAAAVATVDAEALSAQLKLGPVRVHLVLGCQTHPDVPGANVVGELRGSERPDEVVVIGGHLDAWDLGRGAHDDGTGIAHVLEAVRLLKACGVRPKRTIRVVLFANEENAAQSGDRDGWWWLLAARILDVAARCGGRGRAQAVLAAAGSRGGSVRGGCRCGWRRHRAAAQGWRALFWPVGRRPAVLRLPPHGRG